MNRFLQVTNNWIIVRVRMLQVRAACDPAHIGFIRRCRSEVKPIGQPDIDRLRVLTLSDIQTDKDWLFAPVAVTGNRQRQALNDVRAQHFARLSSQPVIRWKRPIATTLLDSEHEEVLRTEFPELTGTFAAGGAWDYSEQRPQSLPRISERHASQIPQLDSHRCKQTHR